jgi:hypothetical protein
MYEWSEIDNLSGNFRTNSREIDSDVKSAITLLLKAIFPQREMIVASGCAVTKNVP